MHRFSLHYSKSKIKDNDDASMLVYNIIKQPKIHFFLMNNSSKMLMNDLKVLVKEPKV